MKCASSMLQASFSLVLDIGIKWRVSLILILRLSVWQVGEL